MNHNPQKALKGHMFGGLQFRGYIAETMTQNTEPTNCFVCVRCPLSQQVWK